MCSGEALVDPASVKVLVVEDEPMIAMAMEDALNDLGFSNVVLASSLSEGLAALNDEAPGLGALDVNVGPSLVFPLADALRQKGVPFFFATGQPPDALPAQWRSYLILNKPVSAVQLANALRGLRFGVC